MKQILTKCPPIIVFVGGGTKLNADLKIHQNLTRMAPGSYVTKTDGIPSRIQTCRVSQVTGPSIV